MSFHRPVEVAGMYAKLSLRNARRSAGDYLLYIVTLIVLSALMMFSNLLSADSNQKGLQAGSVPLLISLVMVALLGYINSYMLRRRAKEFATYVLLGMKKNKIAAVFFGESFLLGLAGLIIGMAAGVILFLLAISFLRAWFPISENILAVYGIAARDSFLYFVVIEVAALIGSVRKVRKMQISSLMSEGRRNQILRLKPYPFLWSAFCILCIAGDLVFVFFITGKNDILMLVGTNMIIFPLVFGIWTFYKAAFHWLVWLRTNRRSELYQGNRLYLTAQLLSKITSNILLNTVLSVCLLFSFITFSVGFIMPKVPCNLFSREVGMWMSFTEICLCIVFIAIYFSILAVKQIVEAKENRYAFRMMNYLGKTNSQRRGLIKQEIILKYALPAVMCLLILLLCVWPANSFLNTILLENNQLLTAVGCFAGCFLIMYAVYSLVAYRLCVRDVI